MLFQDLHNGIAALLNNDAWFTQSPGVTILADGQPKVRKMLQTALNGSGIAVVLAKPSVKRREGRLVRLGLRLVVYENTERNADEEVGTGKTAEYACAKMWALLDGKQILPFSPFRMVGYEETDSGNGTDIWELEFESNTTLNVLLSVLGSGSNALTTESGALLIMTPTEA